MPQRLLQVVLPAGFADEIEPLLEGQTVVGRWEDSNWLFLHIHVSAEGAEEVIDSFVSAFSSTDGDGHLAARALLLVACNVICINLAGVATLWWQGVHPRTWWEAEKAKRATWRALLVWVALLAILTVLLVIF
jgi:hypothetical protein